MLMLFLFLTIGFTGILAVALLLVNVGMWYAGRTLQHALNWQRSQKHVARRVQPMQRLITQGDLPGLLLGIQGAQEIEFTALTEARLIDGNPWGRLWKLAHVRAVVNFQYDAEVIRLLALEGKTPDVFRQGTSWHTPVLQDGELTPLCRHNNGSLYLRVWWRESLRDWYWTESGQELSAAEVGPFLTGHDAYENQGLDRPLVFKTYKLAAVQSVTVDGVTWRVERQRQAA